MTTLLLSAAFVTLIAVASLLVARGVIRALILVAFALLIGVSVAYISSDAWDCGGPCTTTQDALGTAVQIAAVTFAVLALIGLGDGAWRGLRSRRA